MLGDAKICHQAGPYVFMMMDLQRRIQRQRVETATDGDFRRRREQCQPVSGLSSNCWDVAKFSPVSRLALVFGSRLKWTKQSSGGDGGGGTIWRR